MAMTMSGEVQGDERKRTTDEVSKTKGRCRNWRRTPLQDRSRGEPVYCLGGVRHKGGVNLSQALVWNVGTFASRGCKRDGGSPSGIGMQVRISNHLKLLEVERPQVVSVEEKAYEIRQVWIKKVSDKRTNGSVENVL